MPQVAHFAAGTGIPVPLRAVTVTPLWASFLTTFYRPTWWRCDARFGLARYTERSAEAAVSVIVDRIIVCWPLCLRR